MSEKTKDERKSYTYNGLKLTLEGDRYAAVKAFAHEQNIKQKDLIQSMLELVIGEASEESLNKWLAQTKAVSDFKALIAEQEREAGRAAAQAARMRDKQLATQKAREAALALGMSADLLESM